MVVADESAPKDLQYSVTNINRRLPLALLAGIFALAVVVVGRLRGFMALVSLAISFLLLNFFILPAILQGSNPLVVAVIGSSAIMLIALYLCHGLSARTSVAVLGTLISLLLIGVLGSLFIGWAALTGNTDDNTGLIHGLYPSIDMSGLLLAGVIIGSLGVFDDVTLTQTLVVWELHEAYLMMGWRGLYRAGIRIGRDHHWWHLAQRTHQITRSEFQILIESASEPRRRPTSCCRRWAAGSSRPAWWRGSEMAIVAAVVPTVIGIAAQTVPSAYS
ncbi:hypothetical protein STENM327S_03277 [Streptomyces tendae]